MNARGGLAWTSAFAVVAVIAPARAEQIVWRIDNLRRIGGYDVAVAGTPHPVQSPLGRALQFGGHADSLLIAGRPLVGAKTFTVEAIIRPEGGAFEQRVIHIAETDPATGKDVTLDGTNDLNARLMLEVRVKDGRWSLDAFVRSKAGSRPLLFLDKTFPLGRWYAVAQTYDGETYRAYVDGVLQGEAQVAFVPHGPGRVRVGSRMNQVDHFTGSVARLRFTDRALPPDSLLSMTREGQIR